MVKAIINHMIHCWYCISCVAIGTLGQAIMVFVVTAHYLKNPTNLIAILILTILIAGLGVGSYYAIRFVDWVLGVVVEFMFWQ